MPPETHPQNPAMGRQEFIIQQLAISKAQLEVDLLAAQHEIQNLKAQLQADSGQGV